MAVDVDMWRQAQTGRSNPSAWEHNPANRCLGCDSKATGAEFVWIWGGGRHPSGSVRGMYLPPLRAPRRRAEGRRHRRRRPAIDRTVAVTGSS
jgi:hypothetical protein